MAKITLPTNYRDDILNTSAEGKRKYVMSYNQDGTVSFEDVTPYEQVGSDFGAGDINTANEAINQSFDKNKLIRDLDTINALTEEGFAPDALVVKQLNESLNNFIKCVSITGQTNTTGVMSTYLIMTNIIPLSAIPTSPTDGKGCRIVPFKGSSDDYCKLQFFEVTSGTITVLKNFDVTLNFYYIEISN